jgi:hypothetical protein
LEKLNYSDSSYIYLVVLFKFSDNVGNWREQRPEENIRNVAVSYGAQGDERQRGNFELKFMKTGLNGLRSDTE